MTTQCLIEAVYEQNLELNRRGLVLYTWGNVSQIDRDKGLVAIKPSGVSYAEMTADDIVVVDIDGTPVRGKLRPSTDLPTHLALYRAFPEAGGVCHTHSRCATAFSQAGRSIPCLGTTHADYFYGEIPVTREMTSSETESDYEKNTGIVIAEAFTGRNPAHTPAALVKNHGPFTWGCDAREAVYNAAVLEEVAQMAYIALLLNPSAPPAPDTLIKKHFERKHGKDAYYGQK